jgi:hypothetical protein
MHASVVDAKSLTTRHLEQKPIGLTNARNSISLSILNSHSIASALPSRSAQLSLFQHLSAIKFTVFAVNYLHIFYNMRRDPQFDRRISGVIQGSKSC